MNRLARSCSFVVALLVSVSLHGRAAGGAEFRKVTLSYSAVSMTWFPVKIAVEKGFFRSEGLEPQLIQMNGNVATVALAEDKIRKDPDLIKRVIRALLKSLQLLQVNPKETTKILMDWTRAAEKDAVRSLDLAGPGFSKNGLLTDDDLGIEWGFIQRQTKKTNVPVAAAHDMSLLKEVQREFGMQ